MPVQTVAVTPNVVFGDPKNLVLIGGPCVIESEEKALRHAEKISAIARELHVPYVFKASYDKANRSSGKSFRGPGIKNPMKDIVDFLSKNGFDTYRIGTKKLFKPICKIFRTSVSCSLCRQL